MSGDQDQSGVSRRRFLGAAAALAALPQAASANTTEPDGIVEERNVTDDGSYSSTDCGSVPGQLSDVLVAAEMNDAPLGVEGVHEADGWSHVGLRWSSGAVEVGTAVDPEDARDLAERLLVAADAAEGENDG